MIGGIIPLVFAGKSRKKKGQTTDRQSAPKSKTSFSVTS